MDFVLSLLAKWMRPAGSMTPNKPVCPPVPGVDTERRLLRKLKTHFEGNDPGI